MAARRGALGPAGLSVTWDGAVAAAARFSEEALAGFSLVEGFIVPARGALADLAKLLGGYGPRGIARPARSRSHGSGWDSAAPPWTKAFPTVLADAAFIPR